MNTSWNYTELAASYSKRPEYAEPGITSMLARAAVGPGAKVCDVGAGTGHLTLALSRHGLVVNAVEPNDAMRAIGIERTRECPAVTWSTGAGEKTGMAGATFDLVTFGSSFNVTDRTLALIETDRILKPAGWFACMWNHRDLNDPLQAEIESAIGALVPDYNYGTRRDDQTSVIDASRLFGEVHRIEASVVHRVSITDCAEAWRSHGTLHRQAGDRFADVMSAIDRILAKSGSDVVAIPYTTRIWMARKR